ncbi:zf-TFIIB domain-containing protein [Aureibaculum sp. 2210JD6-5]|uniref:TFIIB-type zinc ribbon-containing protein n=1 Tax=Aureibaculum sp. 2210JD6-5 TaxID=3103957 RepID=UPI002AAE40ED|nr:zf-TFIIB domain-containing protein [Aureibaculum sp. 2210JD6-5]MDY7393644.1 zf-TFIIB domain-containing protein [Aureibaculum sp. 2210JD6-5]
MKCPVDGSELEKRVYENAIDVDACNSCNGIWLDANELEKIQDIKINDYREELGRMPDYVGKSILMAKSKDKPTVSCPKCNEEMERREYGYCSQIYIDSCINGHGVWLDENELKDLEVFYERSRMETATMRKGFFSSLIDIFK